MRILVGKREPFRLDERDMRKEITDVLGVPGILNVRIFNGYEIDGVKDVERAKKAVFSEPGQDIIYEEKADTDGAAYVFTIAAAIDQYDQREDFANLLMRVMEPDSKPAVRAFKQIALYGEITGDEYDRIKKYYINPLEMRELQAPEAMQRAYSEPEDVETIGGFSCSGDYGLEDIAKQYGIAMGLDDLKLCREYFAKENRNPTVTEMKVLDAYWSDHCRHSTFLTTIDNVSIESARGESAHNESAHNESARGDEDKYADGLRHAQDLFEQAKTYVYGDSGRPLCLMDIATMEMKKLKKSGALDDMEETDEVNACSIEATVPVDGKPVDMIIMFKNETHNHPTEMEPFGGASTCLGGAIRDPLSGRAYAFGAIRLTGSGDPREPVGDTIPGKLPQRKITRTAAEGYSSYGNGIGLPLGHLNEMYDPGFKAKRMECGAIVAAAEKTDITRGKALPGDIVALVGGNTGRDGVGGATGSSKEHDDASLEKGGAEVQKGNPVIERNIVRLFRKPHVSRLIKKCNDFGAGGVCVAVGELANGLNIDLNKVPVKYPGLDGTELAVSESQERMAVVLAASDLEEFLTEAGKENLNAVKIAAVTDTDRVIMTWRGDEILNIGSGFLNSGGVRQRTNIVVAPPDWGFAEENPAEEKRAEGAQADIKRAWLKNLTGLNVCSKKGIADRFDSSAGGGTVFMPYGGVNQKTPEQGLAMRLPLREGETDHGTLMSVGYDPSLGYKSPFHAAMYAVIESVMKISAMGGDYRKVRLSFQEYFGKLTNDESWGKPYAALMGAFLAQDKLGIPAIGGKDSMSGTFNDIDVPPSLISFAVAVADTTKLVSRAFKTADNKIYLVKTPIDESGVPDFNMLKENMLTIYDLAQKGRINAASVVGAGGIAAAVSEMAFGNGIGVSFDPHFAEDLFTPGYTSLILELSGAMEPEISGAAVDRFIPLGVTLDRQVIEIFDVAISLEEALQAWESALGTVFPIRDAGRISTQEARGRFSCFPDTNAQICRNKESTRTVPLLQESTRTVPLLPQVLIPVFPGSNGEYELERQFRKAGAEVKTLVFRTLTAQDIKDSYNELTEAVNNADILAIPSGMSASAEPDGSGKLIAMILRHQGVKEAINKLVNDRKGLVLGLGEGFKALIKTGLIQTGSIKDEESGEIIYAKHSFNEHQSALKSVKTVHTTSPWLKDMGSDVETVPVSGCDGVVHMCEELYREYSEKGQIASLFMNEKSLEFTPELSSNLQRLEDSVFSPDKRSTDAQPPHPVEAMVSENGLVLGRTGLVDRLEKGLYTNVFSAADSKIFANAVNYVTSRHRKA